MILVNSGCSGGGSDSSHHEPSDDSPISSDPPASPTPDLDSEKYQHSANLLFSLSQTRIQASFLEFEQAQDRIAATMAARGSLNSGTHIRAVEDQFRIAIDGSFQNLKNDILNIYAQGYLLQEDITLQSIKTNSQWSTFISTTILPYYRNFHFRQNAMDQFTSDLNNILSARYALFVLELESQIH